jgi:4-hydroxybenzoyl-CoA thioesterase
VPPPNDDAVSGQEIKTLEVEITFGDCDPFQIVFYPNYFRWFDHATWKLFEAAGLPPEVLRDRYKVTGHPLVKAGAAFSAPTRPGEILTIYSRFARWTARSFEVVHRGVRRDGKLAVEGSETRVLATPDAGSPSGIRAITLPDDIIARFRSPGAA